MKPPHTYLPTTNSFLTAQRNALRLLPDIIDLLQGQEFDLARAQPEIQAYIAAQMIEGKPDKQRLVGAAVQAFFEMPALQELLKDADDKAGKLEQAFTRFVSGNYVSYFHIHPPFFRLNKTLIDGELGFGSDINGWGIQQSIEDQLLRTHQDEPGFAKAAAGWAAFFLNQYEKDRTAQTHALKIFSDKLHAADVSPYDPVSIFEFAGPGKDFEQAFQHICRKYETLPASETREQAQITSENRGIFGDRSFDAVLTKDVFAHRSRQKEYAEKHQAELLHVIADALNENGRLYAAYAAPDKINVWDKPDLLKSMGFRPTPVQAVDHAKEFNYTIFDGNTRPYVSCSQGYVLQKDSPHTHYAQAASKTLDNSEEYIGYYI